MHIMKTAVLSGLALLALALSDEAQAFPTLVNHGYSSCITCHVSPSGGGILNSYGKFVSNELFSVWDDTSTALPWIMKPEENRPLNVMFMGRVAQTYFDTPFIRRGDFRLMQGDVEVSYTQGQFFGAIAAGPRLDSARGEDQEQYHFFVRRFYVGSASLTHAVRAGRFFPEFGIQYYNHNVPTRKGLFFNHNEEPYILQGSWTSPSFDYTAGVLYGAEGTELAGNAGGNVNLTYKWKSTRSGISGLFMGDGTSAVSLHTQVGFLSKGYLLLEGALKRSATGVAGAVSESVVTFAELGWELRRGITPYLGFQTSENRSTLSATSLLPVGVRFYPLSHFEIIGEVGRSTFSSAGASLGEGVSAFVMGNVYF